MDFKAISYTHSLLQLARARADGEIVFYRLK